MDTNKITNNTVKEAFEAWQKGDSQLWLYFFTPDAKLLDDGNPRDFIKFSTNAIGHERFTSIDLVEDNGQSVYGQFHSDTWGNFRTYFKFHINSAGKIYLLEIGQA
ncbi:nuclear transport factor 2 family protein [Chryseobacterium oranimense]|uniref:nuclear transport factor 2 family protein n=1 Tax=Chryseobacterium oranimense TaxID=421058 RepID=UPI002235D15A|nr:nuclear transport factor 2 family protein [Chryseobacterium oranimense]